LYEELNETKNEISEKEGRKKRTKETKNKRTSARTKKE